MSNAEQDWWLAHPEHLDRPHQNIGDYVEQAGVFVPRRLIGTHGAVQYAMTYAPVVMNSELPEEYYGPDRLLGSYLLSKEVYADAAPARESAKNGNGLSTSELSRLIIGDMLGSVFADNIQLALQIQRDARIRLDRAVMASHGVRRYAELTGRSPDEFLEGLKYSYWEFIRGRDAVVVADDAVADRYHIFGKQDGANGIQGAGWHITDPDGASERGVDRYGLFDEGVRRDLVATYEYIRQLPAFNPGHCPIMDMKVDPTGGIWFQRYHRSRDFSPAGLPLDPLEYPEEEGWVKADGVRGALDSPCTLALALWYPDGYGGSQSGFTVPETEEAGVDVVRDPALAEVLAQRRLVKVTGHPIGRLYKEMGASHIQRSPWFKPQAAISLNDKELGRLIPQPVRERVIVLGQEQVMARVAIDAVSDGRRGYVRLTQGVEQPVITEN